MFPGEQSHVPLPDQEECDDTDVSLITGALRSQRLLDSEAAESSHSSALVLRNQGLTVATTDTAGRVVAVQLVSL